MRCAMFSSKWVDTNGIKAAVINIAIGKPLEYKNDMCDMTQREWWVLEPQYGRAVPQQRGFGFARGGVLRLPNYKAH